MSAPSSPKASSPKATNVAAAPTAAAPAPAAAPAAAPAKSSWAALIGSSAATSSVDSAPLSKAAAPAASASSSSLSSSLSSAPSAPIDPVHARWAADPWAAFRAGVAAAFSTWDALLIAVEMDSTAFAAEKAEDFEVAVVEYFEEISTSPNNSCTSLSCRFFMSLGVSSVPLWQLNSISRPSSLTLCSSFFHEQGPRPTPTMSPRTSLS